MESEIRNSSKICPIIPSSKRDLKGFLKHRTTIMAVSVITILSSSILLTSMSTIAPSIPLFTVQEPDKLVYTSGIIGLNMDFGFTLDPAKVGGFTTEVAEMVLSNCYDTLVSYDRDRMDRFRPLLVTEVPSLENGRISPDGLTYRFTIRSDAPLTPEDVEYSFERLMLRGWSGISEALLGFWPIWDENDTALVSFEEIDNAVKIEGNDVVFHLAKIYPPFMHVLASSCSSILCKTLCVDNGDWPGTEETWLNYYYGKESPLDYATQGFGPFIFERCYNTGWPDGYQGIVLVRNENYWRGPAKLEEVEIKIFDYSVPFDEVDNWETRKQMLLDGDADICWASHDPVEEERLWYRQAELESVEGIRIYTDLPMLEYHPLDFHFAIANISPFIGSGELDGNGIPPDFFNDIDIRKAFAYCLDYDTIINESYAGEAWQPTSPILEGLPFHNPDQETYTYDLDMARQHFQQAWGGEVWNKGFNLILVYAEPDDRPWGPEWFGVDPLTPKTAEILKESIEAINTNFHVTLHRYIPTSPMVEVLWSDNIWNLTAFTCPTASYIPDPNSSIAPFLHCTGDLGFWISREIAVYNDSTVNSLIEAGMNTVDPSERQAIYYELQRIYHEEALGIPLVQPLTRHYQRDWLWGWYHNPATAMDFYEMLKGTYQDATSNIITHIANLVDGGVLGAVVGSSLTETLDSAISHMDKGSLDAASQKLSDFIDQVNALDLPVWDKGELTALAQEIIEVLTSTSTDDGFDMNMTPLVGTGMAATVVLVLIALKRRIIE